MVDIPLKLNQTKPTAGLVSFIHLHISDVDKNHLDFKQYKLL